MSRRPVIKYIHWIIISLIVVGIVWFSGFSLRNFISIGGYSFTDQMRTNTSVYYSLASNRSSISAPLFSSIDRKFYKYIFEMQTAFTLRPPSYVDYSNAEVEVVFKPLRQIDIDLEVRSDKTNYKSKHLFTYDLANMQHLPGFKPSTFGDHVVLSREEVLSPNENMKDALYKREGKESFSLYTNDLDLKTSLYRFDINNSFNVDIALQGKHSFLTYTDGRPISFNMTYVDVNEKNGPDRLNLRIKKNDTILEYVQLPDDGNEGSDSSFSGIKSAAIELDVPEEGIYEIELDNSDDIVTQNISLNNQHLVVKDSLKLASRYQGNKDVPLYIAEGGATFKEVTSNTEDAGKVLDSGVLLFKSSEVAGVQGALLSSPNLEMTLNEDQYVSFTKDSFLDLNSITFLDRPDRSKADYIILQNHNATPADRNGWITSSVTFSKDEIFMANDEIPLRFAVNGDNPLYFVDRITVTLK